MQMKDYLCDIYRQWNEHGANACSSRIVEEQMMCEAMIAQKARAIEEEGEAAATLPGEAADDKVNDRGAEAEKAAEKRCARDTARIARISACGSEICNESRARAARPGLL